MNDKVKKKDQENDVEKILDSIWDNWSSRRNCENTHIPEYIKKKNETNLKD